jgi:predicted lipase
MILKYPNSEFTISGHSLGGAIANHAAIHLIRSFPGVKFSNFYTYGQPRTGNSNFSVWFSDLAKSLKINVARVTHR